MQPNETYTLVKALHETYINYYPEGPYTLIMELGPQNHNGDGLLGANSIIVVFMGPLG